MQPNQQTSIFETRSNLSTRLPAWLWSGKGKNMGLITLEQLKRKLRWENISFEQGIETWEGKDFPFHTFIIHPIKSHLPAINLHFDSTLTILDPLGFGSWHAHYDRWGDERRNLVDGLRTVKNLIQGKLCLLNELRSDGKCWGGSLQKPGEIPRTLSKDIKSFQRVFFNQEPYDEQIDFGRYWEGKDILVEWKAKEECEKGWKELGMPIEW